MAHALNLPSVREGFLLNHRDFFFLLDGKDLLKQRKHWMRKLLWISLIGPTYAIFTDLQQTWQTCERWEPCDFREQRWKNNQKLGFRAKSSPLTTPAACNSLIRNFLKCNKHPKRLGKEKEKKAQSPTDVRNKRELKQFGSMCQTKCVPLIETMLFGLIASYRIKIRLCRREKDNIMDIFGRQLAMVYHEIKAKHKRECSMVAIVVYSNKITKNIDFLELCS